MADIKLSIDKIYVMRDNLNAQRLRKEIREYFVKKNHKSRASEYKEGSDNYLKCLSEDEEISKLPEHTVINEYKDLVIGDKRFSVLHFVHEFFIYDEETTQGEVKTEAFMFLVENSHWGFGLVLSYEDLLLELKDELYNHQKDLNRSNWRERFSGEYQSYSMLLNDVMRAEEKLEKIEVYTTKLVIGEKEYSKEYLDKLYDMYVNKTYKFYDCNDKLIEYYDYSDSSFVEFYELHNKS